MLDAHAFKVTWPFGDKALVLFASVSDDSCDAVAYSKGRPLFFYPMDAKRQEALNREIDQFNQKHGPEAKQAGAKAPEKSQLDPIVKDLQSILFVIGLNLAGIARVHDYLTRVTAGGCSPR